MIDNHFRALLPRYTGFLVNLYKKWNLTPNNITVAGLAVALIASFFIFLGWNYLAIAAWWASRLLDGTDGIYARETGQSSFFGAYLDIACDMLAYGAVILALASAYPQLWAYWLAILFLYILCITTALCLGHMEEKLSIGGDQERGMRLGAGLAEAGETGIAYTLFLLFPEYLQFLAAGWIMVLVTTVYFRTALARKVLRDIH